MFCFNFQVEESVSGDAPGEIINIAPGKSEDVDHISKDGLDTTKTSTDRDASPVQWKEAKRFPVHMQHVQAIQEQEAVLEETCCGDTKLKYLSNDSIEAKLDEMSDAITEAEEQHSDLVPAVYEGGLKIWECTWDLLSYLNSSKIDVKDKRVLELGCGCGLLGIYAALNGASQVALQDYNEDVIRQVTLPNILYNAATYTDQTVPEQDGKLENSTSGKLKVIPKDSKLKDHAGGECSKTVKDTIEDDSNGEEERDEDEKDNSEDTVCNVSLSFDASTLLTLERKVQLYVGDWAQLPNVIHQYEANRNDQSNLNEVLTTSDAHKCSPEDGVEINKNDQLTSSNSLITDSSKNTPNIILPSSSAEQIDHKFDVIVTSETVYNMDNYTKLIETLMACLKPTGVVYVSGKSHYFGVGGGTSSFAAAVERTGRLSARCVCAHDQGVRREILEIKYI